jgi:hypothetical protein
MHAGTLSLFFVRAKPWSWADHREFSADFRALFVHRTKTSAKIEVEAVTPADLSHDEDLGFRVEGLDDFFAEQFFGDVFEGSRRFVLCDQAESDQV